MPKKVLCHQAEIAKDFSVLHYRRCFLQCDWQRLGSGDGTIEDRHPLTRGGARRLGTRVARDQTQLSSHSLTVVIITSNALPGLSSGTSVIVPLYIEQIQKET